MKKNWKRNVMICLTVFLAAVSSALPGNAATREELCGVCYEIFVYSFYDSNGDGIGDLQGTLEKLDYINDGDPGTRTDLGCGMIWLMPVFPSPTYHKYDVTDYMAIDPEYGTLSDLETLTEECHRRGVRLILDLPLNHTSTLHPWFQEAAEYLKTLPQGAEISREDCKYAGYYNFTREQQSGFAELTGTDWYYEARFYYGMPDLDLDNEEVKEEIRKILEFWLEKGIDGFRLDAVTSYYTESRQDNIRFLKWLREETKAISPDCYLVGEAWTDVSDYAEYYGSGIDSLFDFSFAGQEGAISALVRGTRGADWYGTKLMEEEKLFSSYNPDAVNAPFYTNHDMARSAGYYMYDDGRRVKMAQALNLLMPGNAFLYYGEELGMKGSGKDENKRAPMYWSSDADAAGLCAGPPEMDEFSMKFESLSEQSGDPDSIYCFVRDVIQTRNAFPSIGCGTTELLESLSDKNVCALIRRSEQYPPVMLLFNLSEEEQKIDPGQEPLLLADAEESSDAGLKDANAATESFVLQKVLCACGGEAVQEEGFVTLPGFSVAVLSPAIS